MEKTNRKVNLKLIIIIAAVLLVVSTGAVLGLQYTNDNCELKSAKAEINGIMYDINGKSQSFPASWDSITIDYAEAVITNSHDDCGQKDGRKHPYGVEYSYTDKASSSDNERLFGKRYWGTSYENSDSYYSIDTKGRDDVYIKFVMYAKDVSGNTPTTADVKQIHLYRELSSPTISTAKAPNDYSVKLKWSTVARANGYEVHKSTSKNGTYTLAYDTGKAQTTVTIKDLKAKTTYYFKVRPYKTSYGKKDYGKFSAAKSAKTTKAKIANVSTIKAKKSGKNAKITWKKTSKAAGYVVYMSTSKNGKYKKVKTLKGKSSTSYVKKSLKKGKTYYFKVKAYRKISGKTYYSNSSKVVKFKR